VVERGQVLERMTVVAVADSPGDAHAQLEALFQAGGTGDAPHGTPVVLAGPHPRLGGSMDSPILAEIVWQLGRRRHPTLRFNWRGVGASTGALGDAPDPADLRAALDQALVGQGGLAAVCAVVGVSLGCAAAAAVGVSDPRVERVVLVAPPLGSVAWKALVASGTPATVLVGEDDVHAPPAGLRAEIAAAGVQIAVRTIAGATHTFLRGLTELGRLVTEALPAPRGFDD
jgi:hypothetical protein